MKRAAFIALLAVCSLPPAANSQTSNVETVKAWKRTSVIGLPGGTLRDPTGTLADAQRLAAVQASADSATGIVAAAASGLTNALERLYAETNRISAFTGRLYLAADMDSDPGYSNVEAYVVSESVDTNGTLHYYVHYTRELEATPKTVWAFSEDSWNVSYSAGSAATNNSTTNVLGYACYDISVTRPAPLGNAILRTQKFLKFGAPGIPLDIPDAGIALICSGVTNYPYTGSVTWTNAADTEAVTETYLSGFLYTTTTNLLEAP